MRSFLPPALVVAWSSIRSGIQYRIAARRLERQAKVHLACGNNVLDGWANVDLAGRPPVIRYDLLRPLPLRSDSVAFIFCEHFIEHVTRAQALGFLGECRRALREGGIIRLSTPDLRKLVDEYLGNRLTEWADVGWLPSSPCALINEGLSFWGHQFVYDEAEFTNLLREAGFHSIELRTWRKSPHAELRGLEFRPYHGELIVEAAKRA